MPLRKPKTGYRDLRDRVLGDIGHLPDSAAVAKTAPEPGATRGAPEPIEAGEGAGTPPVEPRSPSRSGGPQEETSRHAPDAMTRAAPSPYVRVITYPIAEGLCPEYDEIAKVMGTRIANKVILKRAFAAARDLSALFIDARSEPYARREGARFQTNRRIDPRLHAAIVRAYDPLGVLSDYAIAMKIGDCLLTNYIRFKR